MTGYGRAKKTLSNRDITVEVRSVNNRYLDCTVKLPRAYIFAEDAIKGRVQKAISRGKVDVFVTIDSTGADEEVVVVNEGVAKNLSSSTLKDDAYAFIFDQQGLMASLSIEGTKISPIKR